MHTLLPTDDDAVAMDTSCTYCTVTRHCPGMCNPIDNIQANV